MDSEYDRKFEEMKKYIPFLESMIKRLENTTSGSNPRQAQLDKIRSLRDLLMDKKKRMKMENLLKCEQVLVNLYAKVEQRDALPGTKHCDLSKKEKVELNVVRNKLKSVVSKLHQDSVETLPEIARASETEEICVPGSKEPALFQRRPNIPSMTLSRLSPSRNKESLSKRNYTRVLLSPERSEKHWPIEVSTPEKLLFSRRSPKNSPRRRSPTYHKKERKKPSRSKLKYLQSKDLNITLNVPEDSLNSLNTKDILSRIINCSDSDVDIATLRELKTQILGELKETGTNDDISDIILKSYKNKGKTSQNSTEVEEGELSDSESEAIESIYGSLVVLDKNKSACAGTKQLDKEKPRKIQICLVINSDKTKLATTEENVNKSCVDTSDFETFNNQKDEKINEEFVPIKINQTSQQNYDDMAGLLQKSVEEKYEKNTNCEVENKSEITENVGIGDDQQKTNVKEVTAITSKEYQIVDEIESSKIVEMTTPVSCKSVVELEKKKTKTEVNLEVDLQSDSIGKNNDANNCETQDNSNIKLVVDIPLLEPTKQVSEIDILQALKKEILSETLSVLNTDTTTSTLATPPLHQPKITKVSNAQEIGCKKRISIESYKAKTSTTCIYKPNSDVTCNVVKEDISRKQSLKLTEKECERFNFLSKLTLTESSDDEDKSSLSLDDIYTGVAPKSPDHDDFADTGLKPPVIIPSDPVQTAIIGSEADVDMRKLLQNIKSTDCSTEVERLTVTVEKLQPLNFDKEINICKERATHLVDPRKKRDMNAGSCQDSSNPQSVNVEKMQRSMQNFTTSTPVIQGSSVDLSPAYIKDNTGRHLVVTPTLQTLSMTSNVTVNMSSNVTQNVTPSMTCPLIPNMTPNRTQNIAQNMTPSTANISLLMTPNRTSNLANMTPSRTPSIVANMTPNMTPSRHAFDNEDCSSHEHVYAPMFSVFEPRDGVDNSRDIHQSQWDTPGSRSPFWDNSVQRDVDYRDTRNCPVSKDIDYRDQMGNSTQRDIDYRDPRSHSLQRDIDYRDRNNSAQSSQSFEKRDSDHILFPTTSNHPFSSLDCPSTPTPSFGMLEMPMTPVHPFGRSDCPLTPNHPFGRGDSLLPTPPQFLRSDYNSQGVSRSQDPRLKRSSDHDNNQYRDDDRERAYCLEQQFSSGSYNIDQSNRHNNSEVFRRYHREQSVGRNERNKNYESIGRNYSEQMSRREASASRSFNRDDRDNSRHYNRDYEGDRYSRNRSSYGRGYDYRSRKDLKNYDESDRRSYRRERSIARTQETFSSKDRKQCSKLSEENKSFVQSHGDHSFLINTSINSTFQDIKYNRRKFSSSFDARKQRASSVGRTLHSDASNTSTRETKLICNNTEKKIRNTKNFSRACSVGREVESNKRDFNDIKADLKSFKLKCDLRFSTERAKQDISQVTIKPAKTSQDEKKTGDVFDIFMKWRCSKYSPRKNNRDPRMRREYARDNDDHRSSSRYSKNYGIVYSNDNISKGTILGSGYGVKNYKIPKIKRPQVIDTSKGVIDNADIDDVNKSATKITKGLKITTENKIIEQNNENSLDDKNGVNCKSKETENLKSNNKKSLIDDNKNQKSEEQCSQKKHINECIETEKTEYEKKSGSLVHNKTKIAKNSVTNELSGDDITKTQEKDIDKNTSDITLEISSDNVERRLTRSACKSILDGSMSLEISPIKKTKKLKKSFVLDSDSDDSDTLTKLKTSNSERSENLAPDNLTIEKGVSSDQTSTEGTKSVDKDIDIDNSINVNTNKVLDTQHDVLLDIIDKPVPKVLESNKHKPTDVKNNMLENVETENRVLESIVPEEKQRKTEDDVDSSFGLTDLDMFSDNITSDPVVENINALIADLDHDIDSSKTAEINGNFTKELNLETMLENLSSTEKNDDKELVKVPSQEQEENEQNKSQDFLNNLELTTLSEDQTNCLKQGADNIQSSSNIKNDLQKNTTEQKISNPDCSMILTPIKDNAQDSLNKISDSSLHECSNTSVKQHVELSKSDIEENYSNEAIISTSEDCNIYKQEITFKSVNDKEIADSTSPPDSTIKTNENIEDLEQKSVVPHNKDINFEMNTDVTSTLVTDTASKDSLDIPSSDAGSSAQIESIGKLLSILQDKSKIKELLSLLGEQNKNEKIKKKLEKLSEIVSDDESPAENNVAVNTISNVNYVNKNIASEQGESSEAKDDSTIQCIQEEKVTDSGESYYETSNIQKEATGDDPYNEDIDKVETVDNLNNSQEITEDKVITGKNASESSSPKVEELKKIEDRNKQNALIENEIFIAKKPAVKKKAGKKGKRRNACNKPLSFEDRRLTRSDAVNLQQLTFLDKPVAKKPSRELQKLQEDMREMFLKEDILSATGIRMCRIAKLVDEKKTKDDISNETNNQEPPVVPKKCNYNNASEKVVVTEKTQKKKLTKIKRKISESKNSVGNENSSVNKNSSITETDLVMEPKNQEQSNLDPYDFENDSISGKNNENDNKNDSSSESECDSVGSSSFDSTELTEIKKKSKRKRGKGWKEGVIKPKNRKKKLDQKPLATVSSDQIPETPRKLPDFTCFTDRNYCFRKNVASYNCRICSYSGTDIVRHYKEEHPHTEVPLSRMSVSVAKEAIKESEDAQFQLISKLSSKKYVCRFCFKEFSRKKRLLESFFWHIVSTHTGEYKKTCSKCVNVQRCPLLDVDIPPPPKDSKGQLLGYICERCNYTQISLENLKTHVIVWHNDEETGVYTVNLAFLSKTVINHLLKRDDSSGFDIDQPRVLRSYRSNHSMVDVTDDESDIADDLNNLAIQNKSNASHVEKVNKTRNIQSKITFETDVTDNMSTFDDSSIKIEPDSVIETPNCLFKDPALETKNLVGESENSISMENTVESNMSEDIFDYPHFKIKYTESGLKEYVCCINAKDYHYKTTLLISMKKHVQLKHSEKWDGYCCICKVIVTPQGVYKFKDCLQHFIDKHIDNFPILENVAQNEIPDTNKSIASESEQTLNNKSYINVRPLSELISKPCDSQSTHEKSPALLVIESVVSLGAHIEQSKPSPSYPSPVNTNVEVSKQYKYEEFQAEIMSKKHRVVLEAMMSHIKLVQVFKCAGRFCSFTTDNAEHALLHASTHMRVGGLDSLNCVYCDFDSCGNAIDLITHVFKYHGCCPYVCGMCFYRATASQLVNAHIKRLHEDAPNVKILKTSFQTAPIQEDTILSREAAVSYYLCCDKSDPDGPCKFRTYTPGKFCEHLQMRHASATEHLCFICSTSVTTPADLIRHLKIHGLKLYQCTWCIFGADNETELLEHASALHPTRQPKAYLRIITNKEGTSEYRVLPLAQLNKSYVPAIEVTPTSQKDYPVREAERSIELEKLIGQTTLMIESMTTSTEAVSSETEQIAQIIPTSGTERSVLQNVSLQTSETQMLRKSISTPLIENNDQPDKQLTPIIKHEVLELTPEKITQPEPVIVCLDSDEENYIQSASDVPVVVAPTQNLEAVAPVENEIKKVRLTELFLCSRCKMILKCGSGFKKHINACYAFTTQAIPCAHCNMLITKKNIVSHYNSHCDRTKESLRYFCQKCSVGFCTLAQVKDHQLVNHNSTSEGSLIPTYIKEVAPAPKGRRKRLLETRDKAIEPPEKVKRYGPHDINKLPINPILDDSVVCSLCEFNTKVRLNMVRHLQLHAQQQPVPQTAPVNPVPHLETNEKHFDKMVNLASSSVVTKPTDKTNKSDANVTVPLSVPPEAVSRYPKYVPDKHRLTCGAKACSYISVDESMLKCHWETLHHDTNDFHCVHCPSYQHLDTSKPLTATRIIGHLKMHDERLYACSLCSYYHYKRQILEKHLAEVHKGGQVMIVRESKAADGMSTVAGTGQTKTSAPTMDLKPWQCGLCKFKSLLRPEVVEHCAKVHNSKMPFKCAYCAFRTSNVENITKHQSKSHTGKPEEIFYFYYREDSVPDEPDGTARWQKQSQNIVTSEPKVKSEDLSDVPSSPTTQKILPPTKPVTSDVNLNLVKKETLELVQESIDDLCKEFGQFCEPNGLKYKCSLCSNVIEDSLEAMQSHLYEELKYRKWGCSICSYKAFHREGLSEHMQTEHRQNRDPIALPVDNRVETWVAKLLEHQTTLINKYKENLAKQKVEILRVNPGPSISKPQPQVAKQNTSINPSNVSSGEMPDTAELEKIFGPFGASANSSFCCPKCNSTFKEEDIMHSHLESELNKIRWFCSNCSLNFQTYHETQFHCRSVHTGQGARPVEVTRVASVRLAWIKAVIRAQKLTMELAPQNTTSVSDPPNQLTEISENSLLVVRYKKNVPPHEGAHINQVLSVDSDEEKLVIDEPLENRVTKIPQSCPHCTYVAVSEKTLRDHILRHYGLKAFMCPYCGLNGVRKTVEKHQKTMHPTKPINVLSTVVPTEPPSEYSKKFLHAPCDAVKVVCLVCRNYFTEAESQTHVHDNVLTTFGKKGEVVVQCSVCFTLHKDVNNYMRHHKTVHGDLCSNYVFTKLNTVSVESKELLYACGSCSQKFSQLKDLKIHADSNHQSLLKYTLVPKYNIPIIDLDEYEELSDGTKRKNDDVSVFPPSKRIARKSTTKLPNSRQAARKSTTKLPFNVPDECEEFSYYGTKPANEDLEVEIVTMMPFCNQMVPFTLKRLREIINIDPSVKVEKTFLNS